VRGRGARWRLSVVRDNLRLSEACRWDPKGTAVTTKLQQARAARGWSQARLIRELQTTAKRDGFVLPAAESLRGQVSRWENGHVQPDEEYRRLLRLIYGLDDTGLGLSAAPSRPPAPLADCDQLRSRLAGAGRVDLELLQLLDEQTDRVRRLVRTLGAPALLEQMRGHIRQVQALLTHSVLDRDRRPLAAILADAAALAGWQALDVGDPAQAWNFHEVARRAALESGSPCLQAHAMGEHAFVLLDLGQPIQAVALLEEAKTLIPLVPARMRSWLHAAGAEAHAAAGQAAQARDEMDAAERHLPEHTDDGGTPYLSLDPVHLARWRGHTLTRLSDSSAVPVLTEALSHLDGSFARAEAGLRCDLAVALRQRNDVDGAAEHIRNARSLALQTGSLRQLRRLDLLSASAA